jgi:hypothetical protein
MDEIREIATDAEKGIYSMRIYSDRLNKIAKICPDDGSLMHGTGEMYLRRSKRGSHWHLEYLCPKDGEILRGWTPEVDELTHQIAKDVLEEEESGYYLRK